MTNRKFDSCWKHQSLCRSSKMGPHRIGNAEMIGFDSQGRHQSKERWARTGIRRCRPPEARAGASAIERWSRITRNAQTVDVGMVCDATSTPHPTTTNNLLLEDAGVGSPNALEMRSGAQASAVRCRHPLPAFRRALGSAPQTSWKLVGTLTGARFDAAALLHTFPESEPDKRAGTVLKTVGTERSGGAGPPALRHNQILRAPFLSR